jgi:ATP-dependent RNA helicase RhlE
MGICLVLLNINSPPIERYILTHFSELSLASPLMRAISEHGYSTPTPIQARAIPIVKDGHDLLGIAQTGTGKTAAFALPVLDYLARKDIPAPKRGGRVLVLAPTRELAQQIASSFREYARYMDLSVACIFGGASVRGQIKAVVGGNDVLVATPGRLIDLIEQKALRLSDIEVLILDEADQMMDMGFIHALRKIVPLLPKERQTLFFSATMPKKISQLAEQFLTRPKTVKIAPAATTAERVEQQAYKVNKAEKQALLVSCLNKFDYDCALVFSRTKHGADRIVKKLAAAGIKAAALHGNKSQGQRQRILAEFKSGKTKVLIATDIAARGIDIDGITHVINYDLPNVADQYVHRIGRTARAGRSGLAVSFCSPDEAAYLKDIQKLIKQTLPVMPLPENFNKVVAEVSRLKPVKTAGNSHTPRNDPRREKKRKSGFRKKANAAQAEVDSALTDQGEVPKGGPQRSKNPDGSRAERKTRKSAHKPRSRAPRKTEGGHQPRSGQEERQDSSAAGGGFRRKPRSKNRPGRGEAKEKAARPDRRDNGKPKAGGQEARKGPKPGQSGSKTNRRTPRRTDPSAGGRPNRGGGDAPPKRRR